MGSIACFAQKRVSCSVVLYLKLDENQVWFKIEL